ncbi:hypothetical protein JCM5350_002873 [Sporobolomyces pararoseus]
MIPTLFLALFLSIVTSALAGAGGGQPLDWKTPGFSLNRPLYDGSETGYHVIDPKDNCNYLGYGYNGNDAKGYDFKNRGFASLLNVDLDFYAEFEFKHFQIFEYSKSRTINYTSTAVDVSADQKAQLAEEARKGIDSPQVDANSKVSNELLANDGKDLNADHQSGNIRDKLTLTAKRYDELKFKLKTKIEIDDILNQKKQVGEAARFYGYQGGQH